MARKDPYEILGVSRSASADDIRRAYRRLAKEHHPDRNPGNKAAEQRFKDVQAAYEVLGDAERRSQYDRFGEGGPVPDMHSWRTPGRSPFGGGGVEFNFGNGDDLSSIFEQFFSRGGGTSTRSRRRSPAARRRGADLEHEVHLSFEEAARGAAREVRLSGAADGHVEHISFRVPAGVTDGQMIRVRGKGQEGSAGRGDLMVRCRVLPHPYFRREDLDVYLDLPLTFGEAALGTRVEIPTLDGPTWLTVPPGGSSGTKLRLRGKGIADTRCEQTGDMFAIIRIVAPRSLSPAARQLIEQLDRELAMNPRADLGWRL
jgi:DnaJ-class molecular chaperone